MADISDYSPLNGNIIGADNRAQNIVDLLKGKTPVNDQVYDISQYRPIGGIVIGNDGRAYDLVQLIAQMAVTAYQIAVNNGFVGTEAEWLDSLIGEKGDVGKSAYQIAVDNGYVGTEAEWLEYLRQGPKGDKGASAYQVAVAGGYTGTEAEWLASLVGANGKSAYQVAVDGGYAGTEAQWLASLVGANGKSDYQVAVDGGYAGTEAEWLASLVGANGKSAYQVAVDGGYTGTEAEWLASLVGANGKSAYQVAVDGGYAGTQAEWLASLIGSTGVGVPSGGTVGQVLKKTSSNNYDTHWENESAGTQFVLLWTNSSSNSSFLPQTITINLSAYTMVLIEYFIAYNNHIVCNPSITLIGEAGINSMVTDATRYRSYSVGVASVVFYDAISGGATNNNYIIPYKIYGIKGVV